MSTTEQKLNIAILEYLNELKNNPGELDADSIELSVSCLAEALNIDLDSVQSETLASQYNTTLPTVFEAGLQSVISGAGPVVSNEPTAEDKEKAEACKQEGNRHLSAGQFQKAIDCYSEAISLNPKNHIYWNNRAVAYYKLDYFDESVKDAKKASQLEPSYSKAHYRLGLANLALNRYDSAIDALVVAKKCAQTNNEIAIAKEIQQCLQQAQDKKKQEESASSTTSSSSSRSGPSTSSRPAAGAGNPLGGLDLGNIGQMLGGMDIGAMMQNPMMQQMMQSMMGGNMGDMSGLMGALGGMGANGMVDEPSDQESDYDHDNMQQNDDDDDEEADDSDSASQASLESVAQNLGLDTSDPQIMELMADPAMKDMFHDVQAEGPSAVMRYMSNPAVASKMQPIIQQVMRNMGNNRQ